jgi:phosphoesterase RecJ-like protein
MDTATEKFSELLKSSRKILVSSHISPDPDAVCSTLLFGNTIKTNFPDKDVHMVLEEHPARMMEFLSGYGEIEFNSILAAAESLRPELFIMLDAPSFDRCSRNESQALREALKRQKTKIAIIDHHEQHGKDHSDIYINNRRPATAQEVYELLFEKLKLAKPDGYAQTTLLGIISDTARHKFDNPVHRDTYRVVSDLLDSGASIEKIESKMDRYDANQLKVLSNLINNTTDSGEGYTYSFIDDELTDEFLDNNKPLSGFKLGFEEFTNNFLKNFEDNQWGFAVYKDVASGKGAYGVSFRAMSGTKDVSVLAHRLGGGGHKPAAGAKFQAENIKDAIKKVKEAIRADNRDY